MVLIVRRGRPNGPPRIVIPIKMMGLRKPPLFLQEGTSRRRRANITKGRKFWEILFCFRAFRFRYSTYGDARCVLSVLSYGILVTRSINSLRKRVEVFMRTRPKFYLTFHVIPSNNVFFNIFSRNLRLTRMKNCKLILCSVCLSRPICCETITPNTIVIRARSTLTFKDSTCRIRNRTLTSNKRIRRVTINNRRERIIHFRRAPSTNYQIVSNSGRCKRVVNVFLNRLPRTLFFPLLLCKATIKNGRNVIFFGAFRKRNMMTGRSRLVRRLPRTNDVPPTKYDCIMCRLIIGRPTYHRRFTCSFNDFQDSFRQNLRVYLSGRLISTSNEHLFLRFP